MIKEHVSSSGGGSSSSDVSGDKTSCSRESLLMLQETLGAPVNEPWPKALARSGAAAALVKGADWECVQLLLQAAAGAAVAAAGAAVAAGPQANGVLGAEPAADVTMGTGGVTQLSGWDLKGLLCAAIESCHIRHLEQLLLLLPGHQWPKAVLTAALEAAAAVRSHPPADRGDDHGRDLYRLSSAGAAAAAAVNGASVRTASGQSCPCSSSSGCSRCCTQESTSSPSAAIATTVMVERLLTVPGLEWEAEDLSGALAIAAERRKWEVVQVLLVKGVRDAGEWEVEWLVQPMAVAAGEGRCGGANAEDRRRARR